MAAGAQLTRHQDDTLKVYTEDPRLRTMLETAASWWNRATPGAPVVEIVLDEEFANTVVRTIDENKDMFSGLYRSHQWHWTEHPGVITLTPAALGRLDPANTVTWAEGYKAYAAKLDVSTLAHELGHALGFKDRYTPYWGVWGSEPTNPNPKVIPTRDMGIMGVGGPTPNHWEQAVVRKRFGYTVNGIVGDQATTAYVRFINKSEATRARLNARRMPMVNTPTETRTIMFAPKSEPESEPEQKLAQRAMSHKPVPV